MWSFFFFIIAFFRFVVFRSFIYLFHYSCSFLCFLLSPWHFEIWLVISCLLLCDLSFFSFHHCIVFRFTAFFLPFMCLFPYSCSSLFYLNRGNFQTCLVISWVWLCDLCFVFLYHCNFLDLPYFCPFCVHLFLYSSCSSLYFHWFLEIFRPG